MIFPFTNLIMSCQTHKRNWFGKEKENSKEFMTFLKKLNGRTTKFKTNPFWKLYYKELELKSKSLEFKEKYLKGQDITNLIRFEYTIKNNKQFGRPCLRHPINLNAHMA